MALPSKWRVDTNADGSRARVFSIYDKAVSGAVTFDVDCYANPESLSPHAFWDDKRQVGALDAGVGDVPLGTGLTSYKSHGEGQTHYDVYTLTHQQNACQVVIYNARAPEHAAAEAALRTFRWR